MKRVTRGISILFITICVFVNSACRLITIGNWGVSLFPSDCEYVLYQAFHDYDEGAIHWEYIKAVLPKIRKGTIACKEVQDRLLNDPQYIYLGETEYTQVVTNDTSILYFPTNDEMAEQFYLYRVVTEDGRTLFFPTNDEETEQFNRYKERGNEKKLPAFSIEPIGGVIVKVDSIESIQQAYAKLGKTYSDPIRFGFIAIIDNDSKDYHYLYNDIPFNTYNPGEYQEYTNLWMMSNETHIRVGRSSDLLSEEWTTVIPIQSIYDHQHQFDHEYAVEHNQDRILYNFESATDYPNYLIQLVNTTYYSFYGLNSAGESVLIKVSPVWMFNLDLQKDFRDKLKEKGIQPVIGMADVNVSDSFLWLYSTYNQEGTIVLSEEQWSSIVHESTIERDNYASIFIVIR